MSRAGEDDDRFWPFDSEAAQVEHEAPTVTSRPKPRRPGLPAARSTLLHAAPRIRSPLSTRVPGALSGPFSGAMATVRERARPLDLGLLLLAVIVVVLVALALR